LASLGEPAEPLDEDVALGGAKVPAEVGICKEVLKSVVVETGVVAADEECLVVEQRILQLAPRLLRHDAVVRPDPWLRLRKDEGICCKLGLALLGEDDPVDRAVDRVVDRVPVIV
jgi:hypothetical protein